jgi:hypothetical protein
VAELSCRFSWPARFAVLTATKEAFQQRLNASFVTLNLLVTLDAHIAAHNWTASSRQTGHDAA